MEKNAKVYLKRRGQYSSIVVEIEGKNKTIDLIVKPIVKGNDKVRLGKLYYLLSQNLETKEDK